MRSPLFLLFLTSVNSALEEFPPLNKLRPFVSDADQQIAVQALSQRVLTKGGITDHSIVFEIDSNLGDPSYEAYTLSPHPNAVVSIKASSGVSAARGFLHYLQDCCNGSVSWDGHNIPRLLHKWNSTISRKSVGRFRYFANVCTYSYSMLWWNWTRWEDHIDWMALQGINFPLSFTGQEQIYRKVFIQLGMTDSEVVAYFSGPAFLAWNRMGNIKSWGGRLTPYWLEGQLMLQQKIVEREVELGMVPVLPAFAGHVPDSLKKLYPNASITSLRWLGFNCSYTCTGFLDPTDPLFVTIGKMYMTEMKKQFGLYHAYNVDLFNEMTPPSYNPSYVAPAMQNVYKSMADIDPDTVWVMQAWLLVTNNSWYKPDTLQALLNSVPSGKLLLLDLYADALPVYTRSHSLNGQPFIWNTLLNFGGNAGLYGPLTGLNEMVSKAIQFPNSTLVGMGLTMEGMYNNYIVYQFTLDRAWGNIDNLDVWLEKYIASRYNYSDKSVAVSWNILKETLYNATSNVDMDTSALTKRPKLQTNLYMSDISMMCYSWGNFTESASEKSDNKNVNQYMLQLDLVDLTREILMNLALQTSREMMKYYKAKQLESFTNSRNVLLELLTDTEMILNTHTSFMLGPWLQQATLKAHKQQPLNSSYEETAQLYRYNMRNQLTLWGPNGEVIDYAAKQWGGLVEKYYSPRWKLFATQLRQDLINEKPFNDTVFKRDSFRMIENPFTKSDSHYPTSPTDNAQKVALKMFQKYQKMCHSTLKNFKFMLFGDKYAKAKWKVNNRVRDF